MVPVRALRAGAGRRAGAARAGRGPRPDPRGDLPCGLRSGRIGHRTGGRAQHGHRAARRPRRHLARAGGRVPAGDGAAQPPRRALRLQGRGLRHLPCLPGLGRGPDGPQLRPGAGGDGRRICAGLPVPSADRTGGAGLRPLRSTTRRNHGGGRPPSADGAASARRLRRGHRLPLAPLPRLGQAPGVGARPRRRRTSRRSGTCRRPTRPAGPAGCTRARGPGGRRR
ncbi:hypothetical protein SGPA1_50324 [Streptomyces misionensis JCM 4497]